MSTVGIETEIVKMGNQDLNERPRWVNRAHSRVYMPNVPPFWTQSRTHVRSIAHLSSMSTSSSRSISKLAGGVYVAESSEKRFLETEATNNFHKESELN